MRLRRDWRVWVQVNLRCTRMALRQRCAPEGNWCLSRLERWWATLRCVLSLWLDVHLEVDYRDIWQDDPVQVAILSSRTYHSMEWGRCGEMEVLEVARYGLGYRLVEDGWP